MLGFTTQSERVAAMQADDERLWGQAQCDASGSAEDCYDPGSKTYLNPLGGGDAAKPNGTAPGTILGVKSEYWMYGALGVVIFLAATGERGAPAKRRRR